MLLAGKDTKSVRVPALAEHHQPGTVDPDALGQGRQIGDFGDVEFVQGM